MTKTTIILLAGTFLLGTAAIAVAQPMGMGQRGGPMAGPDGMERLFDQFDAAGDGRITQADVDAVRAERHAAFDADGDGVLTLEEYEALWLDAMRRQMVRSFQRLDVDGDGAVTLDEFQAPFARMIDRMPTAEAGVLTRDDVRQKQQERQGWRAERRGERGAERPMRDGRMMQDRGPMQGQGPQWGMQ